MAAASMGYRVVVFCEGDDTPAAQVAHDCVAGKLDDASAVEVFASQCDVITLEFENIPAETIALCGKFAPTYPSASVLATAQDRILEKTTLRDAGLPVTPMSPVHDRDTLAAAAQDLGWPLIVKTARSGYDGKGQVRVESIGDADRIPWADCEAWIAEQCIEFDLEISVVVARTVDGRKEAFPVFENCASKPHLGCHRGSCLDSPSRWRTKPFELPLPRPRRCRWSVCFAWSSLSAAGK